MRTQQMWKPLATLAIIALLISAATAQTAHAEGERKAMNTVHAEVLGGGLLYSINYDRLIIDQLAVRAGFSYLSITASSTSEGSSTSASFTTMMFPITASYVGLYSGSHGLDTGLGATLVYASGTGSGFGYSSSASGAGAFMTAHVGYRLQPVDGGFNFRVGAQALIGPGWGSDDGWGLQPWGYMSLGYTF